MCFCATNHTVYRGCLKFILYLYVFKLLGSNYFFFKGKSEHILVQHSVIVAWCFCLRRYQLLYDPRKERYPKSTLPLTQFIFQFVRLWISWHSKMFFKVCHTGSNIRQSVPDGRGGFPVATACALAVPSL